MKQKRHAPEEIVRLLRESEANQEGYRVWAEAMKPTLEKLMGDK